ncbi:MAG TPA: trehalose-phosphatase, partial [Gemmatimonadaceae bacterium]
MPRWRWAYFLDVDGTLLELAHTPDAVHVESATLDLVHGVHVITGGALALVTGRSIEDVDRLFGGAPLPIAGQHGLERRDDAGNWTVDESGVEGLQIARRRLTDIAEAFDG